MDETLLERRLVLADRLTQAGDPQGELIALQAARVFEDSEELRRAEAAHLERHHDRLLGPLQQAKVRHLTWSLGFLKSLDVSFKTVEGAVAFVHELPSFAAAAELETLTLALEIERADHTPVEQALLEVGAPKSLCSLTLGGRSVPTPALIEVFPNLGSGERWDEVMARVRALRGGLPTAGSALAQLVPRELGVKVEPALVLKGLRAELLQNKALGLVAVLPKTFRLDSIDRALAQMFFEEERKLVLALASGLGGERTALVLADHVVVAEGRIKDELDALLHLDTVARSVALWQASKRDSAGGKAARKALKAVLGAHRGPRMGLFDRSLPAELPMEMAQAYARFTVEWLERLMIGGHRLSPALVRAEVAVGPRSEAARRLVWGCFDGERCVQTFLLEATGFVDVEGRSVQPSTSQVGVPHALELDRATREGWLERLASLQVRPPFEQLRRPIQRLHQAERTARTLDRFAKQQAAVHHALPGLWAHWQGWDQQNDAHLGGIRLEIEREGTVYAVWVRWGSLYGGDTTVSVKGGRPFGQLPRIVVSEILAGVGEVVACQPVGIRVAPPGHPGDCVECGQAVQGPHLLVKRRHHLRGDETGYGRIQHYYDGTEVEVPVHWACAPWVIEVQLRQRARPGVLERLEARFAQAGIRLDVESAGPVASQAASKVTAKAPEVAESSAPTLPEEVVLARCPDDKARKASVGMAKASQWEGLGHDGTTAWGQAKGSQTYEVSVHLGSDQAACTCPSRKLPCKHAVGLWLLYARGEVPPA